MVRCTTSTFRKSQKPSHGLSALSSVNLLATMSFNSVIPLRDSTRADWKLESTKLEVTLTPSDLGVGVCVSRCNMSAWSFVDSERQVSWNGSMCTVSHLDAEPAAALAWEADPFGALKSLFPLRWRTIAHVVHQEVKIVSGPFLTLCRLWSPQDRLHVSDLLKSVRWLWNHFWQASFSKLFSSQNLSDTASLLDLSL